MSVIVKGMKMPDCCGGCELHDSDDDGIYCTVLEVFMRFDELPKGRRSDCPLAEMIRCKDCKHFEYDNVEKVDGIPLIVAHEICKRWGKGCKTSENGWCFLAERKEDE